MIIIEILLIIIWLMALILSIVKQKSGKNASLLISGFIVGAMFIWLDNSQGQIFYTTSINFPIIDYPIAIIALAALYFFSIVKLGEYINNKLFKNVRNSYVLAATGFLIIAMLNFLCPIVDYIIVNMEAGVFKNNHINLLYKSFEYNHDILLYQIMAYLVFLLAIYLSIWLSLIFVKLVGLIVVKSH